MIKVSFHNVDQSDALYQYLVKKTKTLQKFLSNKLEADWTISTDGKFFAPTLNIFTKGKTITLSSKSSDPFQASGMILAKAKNTLSKRQTKNKSAHRALF